MGKLESDLIKKKMEERESTAPCLQGVSTEFVLIEKVRVSKYRINTDLVLSTQPMSTNSLLTPCKQGAVRYSPFLSA